jgi:probable rRNA maturation factor
MRLRVELVETSPLWRDALPARKLARRAIAAALEEVDARLRRGAEVTVHLVADADIQMLNQQWRGKDEPTNVLSFDQAGLLGDIVIAFETVVREAAGDRKPLADHFCHLVIHGFLHLLGFDHVNEADAEEMEAIEILALDRIEVANPYAADELMDAFE